MLPSRLCRGDVYVINFSPLMYLLIILYENLIWLLGWYEFKLIYNIIKYLSKIDKRIVLMKAANWANPNHFLLKWEIC